MASPSSPTVIDSSSPLYLHPSDGSTFITIEKLLGTINYRSWRRSLEIGLSSKRKFGFINGIIKRDGENIIKQKVWDTCNNMIISWILNSVSDSIKKTIMFLDTAYAMWEQLEKRFLVVNGARKYQLNRAVFSTKQTERCLSDYYIKLKGLWEEIESLNQLPVIVGITEEIKAFLAVLLT